MTDLHQPTGVGATVPGSCGVPVGLWDGDGLGVGLWVCVGLGVGEDVGEDWGVTDGVCSGADGCDGVEATCVTSGVTLAEAASCCRASAAGVDTDTCPLTGLAVAEVADQV